MNHLTHPFTSDENIFELMPIWYHPLFSVDDEYKPVYRKGTNRLEFIGLPDMGSGGRLEASTHEFAHMIDIVLNNQHERLLQVNYGMEFDRVYKNIEKIIDRELKVVAIQCKLFSIMDKDLAEIEFAMEEIINSFSSIASMAPHFNKFKSWEHKKQYIEKLVNKCRKMENELSADIINIAIKDLHNFLDEHACIELRKRHE